jgi:hypothetical protein
MQNRPYHTAPRHGTSHRTGRIPRRRNEHKENPMANNQHATFQKRQKERARQQKQQEKAARRLAARQQRGVALSQPQGTEDPDIAGIEPGPQPLPEQWQAVEED